MGSQARCGYGRRCGVNPLQKVLESLETACGNRCNAEYNPCHYREAIAIVNQMMQAEPICQYQMGNKSWIDQSQESYEYNKLRAPDAVLRIVFSAPQAVPAVCEWTQDADFEMGDTYHSSCGELWSFIDGGPKENRVSYCHHCGKPVKLASAPKGTV
jgi:hypothetical protein